MIHAVCCPSCENFARVGAGDLGRTVACPHCGRPFTAESAPEFAPERARPEPVVARLARPRTPVVARLAEPDDNPRADQGDLAHGPSPLLVALTLLPLGIPLLWLAAPVLTGVKPVFSFAAPVAIALGLGGLTLGIGFAHGWSPGTRIRASLAVILVGYFAAGFLYFMKKEWAEAVRKHVGPESGRWVVFTPPTDRAYQVRLPGQAAKADAPLAGWELEAYRFAPDRKGADALAVAYEIAHGQPPRDFRGTGDEEWFSRAKAAVCGACSGELVEERTVRCREQKDANEGRARPTVEHPGREYVLSLPDGATNRIVRVFRVKDRAFYLAVEGAFIPGDARYVKDFFNSFEIAPR